MSKKAKRPTKTYRSPALIILCSLLIVMGSIITILAVAYHDGLGLWPSIIIGLGGLTTTAAATTSIITNDPNWILLDLILPG